MKEDGVFCLPCIFFPTQPTHGFRAKRLISKPYSNRKKIHDDLSTHETLQYHLTSMAHLLEFKKTFYNPRTRIDHNINENSIERVKANRSILAAIIKPFEFCGRNDIAVRGHRDDGALNSSNISKKSGNLRSLINFRIDDGDKILENHLNSCSKPATYISKTTQNELLLCIKNFIQSKILNEVKNQSIGPLYGIMADEVTDTSNKEQLDLVLCYTIGNDVV